MTPPKWLTKVLTFVGGFVGGLKVAAIYGLDEQFKANSFWWELLIIVIASIFMNIRDSDYYVIQGMREEVRRVWLAVRGSGISPMVYNILEKMAERIGYGKTKNNPPNY